LIGLFFRALETASRIVFFRCFSLAPASEKRKKGTIANGTNGELSVFFSGFPNN
jgi:hypothetical protein